MLAIELTPGISPTNATYCNIKEEPTNYSNKHREQEENKSIKLLKRVSLERLMDLKVDYAFKQLFGNEKNKEITVVFLNAILKRAGREAIKDISFQNTESGGEYFDDKQSKLDLLVVTNADEQINVEIQFTNKYDMIKRTIYYWAGAYRQPFKKKMAYKELRPVIAINILNFNLFSQTERFHTTYHLYEDVEKSKLTDVMEFHFIEMPKLLADWKKNKLDPWNDCLARWLLMLGLVDHRHNKVYHKIFKELEVIAMNDKNLRDAFQSWEELSMTQEQYLAYESRLKRIRDEEAYERRKEMHEEEKRLHEEEKRLHEQEKRTYEREKRTYEQEKGTYEQEKRMKEEEIAKRIAEIVQREKKANQLLKVVENHDLAEHQTQESIARRMLLHGMEIDVVMKITELSKEKVFEIQQETLKED